MFSSFNLIDTYQFKSFIIRKSLLHFVAMLDKFLTWLLVRASSILCVSGTNYSLTSSVILTSSNILNSWLLPMMLVYVSILSVTIYINSLFRTLSSEIASSIVLVLFIRITRRLLVPIILVLSGSPRRKLLDLLPLVTSNVNLDLFVSTLMSR